MYRKIGICSNGRGFDWHRLILSREHDNIVNTYDQAGDNGVNIEENLL